MNVFKTLILCFFIFTNFFVLYAQENIIPRPQEWKSGDEGYFSLNKKVWTVAGKWDKELTNDEQYLKQQLLNRFNIQLKKGKVNNADLTITTLPLQSPYAEREGYYELVVSSTGITIAFSKPAGLFYAVQTLLQIIENNQDQGRIPNQTIIDYPTFAYRGMMLDVSRHFFSVDEVKQFLDYLAAYKINKFHWHLTDDQGWRIEIKSHPKLTEFGAYRTIKEGQHYPESKIKNGKYGGYYTQEQIKEVIDYARKLHIDVIPEIEMPGHSQAALAVYPELSCSGEPLEVWTEWGVSENVYCPKEETFRFLQDVIDEVITLFPSEYIHIGGDEAPKTQWKSCAFCQDLIKKEGLKDEHELQSYFIKRMEKYINSKGKKIIGWDEILEGGLAPNATVMSWTGQEGAIHAARQGNDAIMTPSSHLYFDYYQGNPQSEPLAFNAEIRLEDTYGFNPVPGVLTPEEAKHILGPQANLWTERIQDFSHVEYMIFPRLFALSEVGWGTSEPQEYRDFENRVIHHFKHLDKEGINYSKAIFEVSGTTAATQGKNYYSLKAADPSYTIRYTMDGTDPNASSKIFEEPIEINKSMTVKAASFKENKQLGSILSQDFLRSKSTGKSITLEVEPSSPYLGNGASTLVDGIFGHPNSFKNNWLGFNGTSLSAVIDLGELEEVTSVRMHILDFPDGWIHTAKSVKIYVSTDGVDYKEMKALNHTEIKNAKGQLVLDFPMQSAKYIKIEATNSGKIPAGYPGAGYDSWMFVDELIIQ